MIVLKIQGGLGNQLFNYALGRKLAILRRTQLKLDLSFFQSYHRDYQLDSFCVEGVVASEMEIERIRDGKHLNPLQLLKFKARRKLAPYYLRPYVIDHNFRFDENFFKGLDNTYYAGTWQSEKYFSDIRDILLKEIVINTPIEKENLPLLDEIKRVQSVCIHVRRDDYLSDPVSNRIIGVLDTDYYKNAVQIIRDKVDNPFFFVFSDDPGWVETNMDFPSPCRIVTHNAMNNNPIEDFRLMQQCRHFIIANSTFSWWAAWLSEYYGKIVIAPKQWFISEAFDTDDVVPETWLRI